jgi:arginyl-tRNA synthetase
VETIHSQLEAKVRLALPPDSTASPQVTIATDARFGDYQSNAAMSLAKTLRRNPREVAAEIVSRLDVSEMCAPPKIAGAGFINFRLRDEFLARKFAEVYTDPNLGVPKAVKPKKIVVDFSSPNVAKPMHVGHIRSTLLGDVLVRIARFLGHEVTSDNHLGDWGTQFGKVIFGFKKRFGENLHALESRDAIAELVAIYKETNALAESDETVLKACRDELVKLQADDPVNRAIWDVCVAASWRHFTEIYRELGIEFDEHLGESHYNSRLAPLVDRLLTSGIAEFSEGAVCIFFRDDPALSDKPCLIRKSDGGFLYATTDLATIEYRLDRWKPDEIWYVVGSPQQLHFNQVFAAAKKMGISTTLCFVPFGSILGEDRKLMKTRTGESVPLHELLAEARERARAVIEQKNPELSGAERAEVADIVGIGAVKYAELSQFRMTDYIFSWEKMLSLQGNTAPYLQNAFVRIQSIFRKLKGGEQSEDGVVIFDHPAEKTLAKKLAQFGETVPQVLDDFRPNILANYLYELADTFHTFYEACPVLKSEGATRQTRIKLCDLTARILKHGLFLLGIQVPSRM